MSSAPALVEPAPSTSAVSSHSQILKSSAIVGGSSAINMGLGIVRTKCLALLLGPAGVGLMSMFNSITSTATALAGMGVGSSGVRQIAAANSTNDQEAIARTIWVLRRTTLLLGIIGALALVAFSKPISVMTFGHSGHQSAIAVLSVAVLLEVVAKGQSALIQGLRQVRNLALIGIIGALVATVVSIPLIYFFQERGIVPFLLAVSGATAVASWWYARKVEIAKTKFAWRETWSEASALLKLGFVLTVNGLLAAGVAYLSRILITRKLGIDAAGMYQASWALSGMYVGFILSAMGADFYPRLTAAAKDKAECNRLINEQAEVAILLAAPAILAMLAFAPLVIFAFYSGEFGQAVEILRWQSLGVLLRVIAYPLGFLLLAQGQNRLYLVSEVLSNLVHLGLIWLGLNWWGLPGTGAAFFGLYLFSFLLLSWIAVRLTGFSWSPANRRLMLILLPAILGVFALRLVASNWAVGIVGGVIAGSMGLYSVKQLNTLAGGSVISRFLAKLGFKPAR
jgi:enterobacterial common antigen flippase